jgi:hypothetical protein
MDSPFSKVAGHDIQKGQHIQHISKHQTSSIGLEFH